MIKQLLLLQNKYADAAQPTEEMNVDEFKSWLSHPYTKLLHAELTFAYLDCIEFLDDFTPTDTHSMVESGKRMGERHAIERVLNYFPFNKDDDEQ